MQDEMSRDATQRMGKCVAQLKDHYRKMRTGRANVGLLDGLKVDYYGAPTPLKSLASITVPEPRMIMVKPFDDVQRMDQATLAKRLDVSPADFSRPLTEHEAEGWAFYTGQAPGIVRMRGGARN